MTEDNYQIVSIEKLQSSDASQMIMQVGETISSVQQSLYKLAESEDSKELNLLKIGSVFQIFFLDTLATGKKPEDLKKEDWAKIASNVNRYAVMEDGQSYSEFVFTLYANYIDISAELLKNFISERYYEEIKVLSLALREKCGQLKNGEISEISFTEDCLWLSLEAMMKLLCTFFTAMLPQEYKDILKSVSQFAFEYGRLVLYQKEQALLEEYLQNQRVLDEELSEKYEDYLKEVRAQADTFQKLIDDAFSPDIRETLMNSAALARAAGVKEDEILTSVEDVDAFFLD